MVGLAVAGSRGIPVAHPENCGIADLVGNLLLVHAWRANERHSWNAPSWSISTEWTADLTFPAILALTGRLRPPLGLAAAPTVATGILTAATALGSVNGLLPRYMGEFVAGCLLGRVFLFDTAPGRRWSWAAGLAAAAAVAIKFAVDDPDAAETAVVPLIGLVTYALARGNGSPSALLAAPVIVFWGEASYSLYMTHAIVAAAGDKIAPLAGFADASAPVRGGVLLAYTGTLLGMAALTYLAVERPARSRLRAVIADPLSIRSGNR